MPPSARSRLITHRGVRIHFVEQGEGPLVLLLHGFPQGWRAWRSQLPALAAAGFHVAALDLRGYGRSSAPAAVEDYRMLAHVGDNVAVVEALGYETAIVVGHDWGSPIAAASALTPPDMFTAVGLLGVPYSPPGGPRPTEVFAQIGGNEEFYVSYFQEPGRAEAEIEPDVRGWLVGFHAALSSGGNAGAFFVPPGGRLRDRFPAQGSDAAEVNNEELANSAAEFERTGLQGALNRYRNVDRDWEDLSVWHGQPLRQPSIFLGGADDASVAWLGTAIDAHPTTLPGLLSSQLLAGCGHWLQEERPEEINRLLTDWLRRVAPTRGDLLKPREAAGQASALVPRFPLSRSATGHDRYRRSGVDRAM